jgi:NHLM bacteriocin system ABC transporter ATP-binding protein
VAIKGWFENQIRARIRRDDENVADSLEALASVLMGKRAAGARRMSKPVHGAVEEICRYYRVPFPENERICADEGLDETLDRLLRPSGIMRRRVYLDGEWWKRAAGSFLCESKSGTYTAVIPKAGGYRFFDYDTGRDIKVNGATAKHLKPDAVCFYRPLPEGKLTFGRVFGFMLSHIGPLDLGLMSAFTLAATLLGMFFPRITQLLFSDIIPSGRNMLAISVGVILIGSAVSALLANTLQNLAKAGLSTKLDTAVETAVISRVVNLPASFFKDYSAGELAERIQLLNSVMSILCEIVFGASLTAVFSLLYIAQISSLAPSLYGGAWIAILIQVAAMSAGIAVTVKSTRKKLDASTRASGIVYALFCGIRKIKLAACEKRAFAKWSASYKKYADATYNVPLLPVTQAIRDVAPLLGSLVVYLTAAAANAGVAEYISFTAAFGLVSGSVYSLSALTPALGQIKPLLEMGRPILGAEPETNEDKPILKSLSGKIEINNVSFRYDGQSPMIIDNLSLKIRRGQYVAIVGKTGCGKSTLLRLLLGFEKPIRGAIYYDNEDISKIDLHSLRRKIGVVMQTGKLFQGDIYSNIVISAPQLSLDDAWGAAEAAGIADTIRSMPMGMHTVISEGAGSISGGQRQRIMIARAIAPKPGILFFDEATSALDNITQKHVSDALAALKSTRVVIAHRLSTIKQCDRIVVLNDGRIIEDGTYDELIAKNGFFAELVSRQRIDVKTT